VIATQRAFRTGFELGRNASVPERKPILLWIYNLRATGSTLKRKSPGRPGTVRTAENVEDRSVEGNVPWAFMISLRRDVGWPARSPDLNPCDFFLWGYLKEKFFKHRPRSLEDFKGRI